jgi:16S rRNA (guanine(966)-N(2))-methyltransferase RsmD
MRIISGKYKSRVLSQNLPDGIRPTTDIARESIFNILNNLVNFEETKVLDLFAGTGAFGLEALSRGAKSAHFVEKSIKSIQIIKKNIETLNISKDEYLIIKSDVQKYMEDCNEQYDIIFADPPYVITFFDKFIDIVKKNKLLADDGIIIFEMSSQRNVDIDVNFELIKIKEIGSTKFYFIKVTNIKKNSLN